MAAKLGQRLAQAVVRVRVGTELEELTVGLNRGVPVAVRGIANRLIGELPPLAVGGLHLTNGHGLCSRLRVVRM